jgi:hypothetical protein
MRMMLPIKHEIWKYGNKKTLWEMLEKGVLNTQQTRNLAKTEPEKVRTILREQAKKINVSKPEQLSKLQGWMLIFPDLLCGRK